MCQLTHNQTILTLFFLAIYEIKHKILVQKEKSIYYNKHITSSLSNHSTIPSIIFLG